MVALETNCTRFWPTGAEHRGVEGGAHIGGEPFLPLHLHDRLDARRLQRLGADDALDEELLRAGAAVELLGDLVLEQGPQHRGDHQIDRDRGEDDQRQHRRIDEHHREEDDGEDEIEQRGQSLSGEEGADGLELAHARHRLAGRARLEIGERQAEEVGEEAGAELDVDAVGGVVQRIGAQELQQRLEDGEQHHADDQHDQRREPLVDEHLVDHQLEEHRRQQGEELHEERRDHHLDQRLAVAHQRRQKPTEAEGLRIDAGGRGNGG